MKKTNLILTLILSTLSFGSMATNAIKKDSKEKKDAESFEIIPKESAVEFGKFIETHPQDSIIRFETTTRMMDYEKKIAYITDVSKITPPSSFDQTDFVEVKEFIMDFSDIPFNMEFNPKTYPQKRIQDECTLITEEYGLYIEGQFVGDTFKVDKLKPKYLSHITNRYCD